MNNLSIERLKMMRQRAIGDCWSKEYISVFDELIAIRELKGDQVPVEYQQRTKPKWDDHHPWSDWEKCSEGTYNDLVKANLEICDWIHEVRELFTAPQKPVVLLPVAEDYPIAWSAASVLADVKAAIESAGGIVKDGE